MKIYNYIVLAAAITIGLSSCNKDEDYSNVLPEGNIVKVDANVRPMVKSSTMETTDLSEFGLFIENADDSRYSYSNYDVTKSAGETAWTTSEQMLWKSATQMVTVYAYFPYTDAASLDATGVGVCANQSVEDSIKASDFLYSSSDVTPSVPVITNPVYYDKNSEALNVTLKHNFSKVIISLTLNDEFNYDPGTDKNPIDSVYVCGTDINANFSIKDDVISDLSQTSYISAYNESYNRAEDLNGNATAVYECIVIPQTIDANNFSVEVYIDGKKHLWTDPSAVTFKSGKKNTLSLEVGDNLINLLKDNISITDWNKVDGIVDLGTD